MHAHISRAIWAVMAFALPMLPQGSPAIADALSAAVPFNAVRISDEEMATLRGQGLLSFISGLIGVLPPGNTVSIQIGSQPTVTNNGPGPQSLTISLGGTTASTSAGNTTTTTIVRQWH